MWVIRETPERIGRHGPYVCTVAQKYHEMFFIYNYYHF